VIKTGKGINTQSIDLRLMAAGTYILKIETSSGTTSKKIIKTP